MMQNPDFLKQFSQSESKNERTQAAEEILNTRKEIRSQRQILTSQTAEIQHAEQEISEKAKEIISQLEKLNDELESFNESSLTEIQELMRFKNLKAEIATGKNTLEEIELQKTELTKKKEAVQAQVTELPSEFIKAQEILSGFYSGEKTKWAEKDFDQHEIKKYFTEENLSSLSIEDYALLMKRFPSEMVTHVTRQGIRDHAELAFHTTGLNEYKDGFKKILEDGRLRSPLAIKMIESGKEEGIKQILQLDSTPSREHAIKRLKMLTEGSDTPGSYADKSAIHFAANEVPDTYYGSERGNEIFIAYPAALIASQYKHSGQIDDYGGGYWNDKFVYAKENEGMDINAGLTFIPGEAKVDPKTGSIYETDEHKQPIVNQEYQKILKSLLTDSEFKKFCQNTKKAFAGTFTSKHEVANLQQELATRFGINNKEIAGTILNYYFLNAACKEDADVEPAFVDKALQEEGLYFKKAVNTTSSKEYWEEYFRQTGKKPNKIIYYKGKDPTTAMREWLEENNITKKSQSKNLGFESEVDLDSTEANPGLERFIQLAMKEIDKTFPIEPPPDDFSDDEPPPDI